MAEQPTNRMQPRASDLTVSGISDWVKGNVVDIDPSFQRRDRWNKNRQSKLIESFLLGIPVPPVYLKLGKHDTYDVIDGRQRMAAIHQFVEEGQALEGLEILDELNGKKFADLPVRFQNLLKVEPAVRVVTIGNEFSEDDRMTIEVFHRLNTGGVQLGAQEIRNALYSGKFNDLLEELADNDFMRAQLKVRRDDKGFEKMKDHEYVLRFLTIKHPQKEGVSDLANAMDRFMVTHRNAPDKTLNGFRQEYHRMVDAIEKVLGSFAFRRWSVDGQNWRDQQNIALYDAQSQALAEFDDESIVKLAGAQNLVEDKIKALFNLQQFQESISGATASEASINTRVRLTKEALESCLT